MPKLTITERAAKKGNQLLGADAKAKELEEPGLRVRIVGGGCSGLSYKMEFGDPAEGDEVFEQDGFKVYVDKKSMIFLNGSELDYAEALTGAGFQFSNPNVKGSCGCGESFHV